MNALPFTITTLLLLSILTYSAVQRAADQNHLEHALLGHLQASRELEKTLENDLYELKILFQRQAQPRDQKKNDTTTTQSKPKEEKKKTKKKRRELTTFPALLDLAPFLYPTDPHLQSLFGETLLKLMHRLYRDQPFSAQLPQIVQRLSTTEQQFQGEAEFVEQLASLSLHDPALQQTWADILRGKPGAYPSLLDYVALNPQKPENKINIAFAPPELLEALFDDPTIASQIRSHCQALVESYNDTPTDPKEDQKKRKEMEDSLKVLVERLLLDRTHLLDKYQKHLSYNFYYRPSTVTRQETRNGVAIRKRRRTTLA